MINTKNIKTFLVGGAVRDQIIGVPVKDRDWVVVGATVQDMIDAGFSQVGKDFPVFLHPETGEEHALARKERTTGGAHDEFEFNVDPSVTLEEDLVRRDCTMNAIAMDDTGNFIDPFGGVADIKNKIIRHTSDAFKEDPVRILRVARFFARFGHLGFKIAPETIELMTDMVSNGDVEHLVPERVWQEMEGALGERSPMLFVLTMALVKAWADVCPELEEVADNFFFSGIDFNSLCSHDMEKPVRMAVLCKDLTLDEVNGLVMRLKLPNEFSELLLSCVCVTPKIKHSTGCNDSTVILNTIKLMDFRRNPEKVETLLRVGELTGQLFGQGNFIRLIVQRLLDIDEGGVAKATSDPKNIPDAINSARLKAIDELMQELKIDSNQQIIAN